MEYKFTKPNLLEIVIIITLIFVVVLGWLTIKTIIQGPMSQFLNQTAGLPVAEWQATLSWLMFIGIVQWLSLIVLLKIAAILEGIRKKL